MVQGSLSRVLIYYYLELVYILAAITLAIEHIFDYNMGKFNSLTCYFGKS